MLGLKRRDILKQAEAAAAEADQSKDAPPELILGKEYFRDPATNYGFYSKKREGVSDVDPKVSPSDCNRHFRLGHGAI